MKKNLFKAISLIVFIGLLIWLAIYIKNNLGQFGQILRAVAVSDLIALALVALIFLFFQGLILKTILEPFGIELRFREWFGISVATVMGNYIFPFAGLGIRALYLRNKHQFKYSQFLSITFASYLIEFAVFSLAALFSLIFGYFPSHFIDWKLFLFFLILLILMLFLAVIPKLPKLPFGFGKVLASAFEGWQKIKQARKIIFRIIYLTLWEFIFFTSILFFAYRALNLNVSFIQSFQVAALSDLAFIIRILPASFGFYEGAIAYFNHLFAITLAQGLTVALLSRLSLIVWAFTLGIIFSYVLLRYKKPAK